IGQIDSGATSAGQASADLIRSLGDNSVFAQISRIYYAIYSRAPDLAGLNFWQQQITDGSTLQVVYNFFNNSAEFAQRYGNASTNQEYVSALYTNVFSRASDAAGEAFWVQSLDNRTQTRDSILAFFTQSPENIILRRSAIDSYAAYEGILGREPTQAEMTAATTANDLTALTSSLLASSEYSGIAVPGLSRSGVVVDGYISGATVFIDVDNDGIQDTNEPVTTTNAFGVFDFGTNANFGDIVASGGTDISTQSAHATTYSAPSGSTVVSPLTTLVDRVAADGNMTVSLAQTRVRDAFGLDSSIRLLTFDPIAAISSSTTTIASRATGLAVQTAATQIDTFIDLASALLLGTGASTSSAQSLQATIAALSVQIRSLQSGQTIALGERASVQSVIEQAITNSGATADVQTRTTALAGDTAQIVANLNTSIHSMATTNADDGAAALRGIAQVQLAGAGIQQQLQNGAANSDISQVLTGATGDALTTSIAGTVSQVGNVAGDPNFMPTTPTTPTTPGSGSSGSSSGGTSGGGSSGGGASGGGGVVLPIKATDPTQTTTTGGSGKVAISATSTSTDTRTVNDAVKAKQLMADLRFSNIDGSGHTVVIIDTGIDLNHPFFGPDANGDGVSDRIIRHVNFVSGVRSADDTQGHGTHVAGIAASSDTTYGGVAPGANIIALQVFGPGGTASFRDVEQALQWVISNVGQSNPLNIASVNLSLGSGNFHARATSPLSDEFIALNNLGVLSVVASGNSNLPAPRTAHGVAQPANDAGVMTVGATFFGNQGGLRAGTGSTNYSSDIDHISSFTQRSTTLLDIFAPGVFVPNAGIGGRLSTQSGTSMAAPVVAGAAALAQQIAVQNLNRRLTTTELTSILLSAGDTINDGDDERDNVVNTNGNFPRLNVLKMGEAILA
ncbi:MAG: S8 family serine peptidase, partial [Pseudomonadota bacterium]